MTPTAHITLTTRAREYRHRYDEASGQLVDEAMTRMSAEHRDQLERALLHAIPE